MSNSVIGALRVMLGMDTAEFEAGADAAARRATRLERDIGKTGENLARTGRNLTLALTAPLAAFGVTAFNAATDAAELQSAFDQTFGALSADMNRWAEETGNAMGRSTQSMQQMANTFGIFFNQAAPTREEAAAMSRTFSVLAQDLASFYNVAESDALAKLRSGLSGEAEPLRDFGVFLTEAAVKAKALELGLADASGEISEQAKIMARYQLILEGTANAQGDVARTADGTANRMRAAQAAFQELQVSIGTKLLPVITPLIEKLTAMLDRFTRLPDGVQTFALGLAAVGAALGPVLMGIGGLMQVTAPLLGALGALAGQGGILLAAKGAFLALAATLGPFLPVIAAVAATGALIYANWDKIAPVLSELWTTAQETLGPPLRELVDALSGVFTALWEGPLGVGIRGVMDQVRAFMALHGEVFGRVLVATLQAFAEIAARVFNALAQGIRFVGALLTGDFAGAWRATVGFVEAVIPGITSAVQRIYEGVRNWLLDRLGAVFDGVRAKIQQVEETFAWLWDRVVGNSWIPDMVEDIGSWMGQLGRQMVDPAVDAAQATDQAFASMADNVLGSVDRLISGIKRGGLQDILGGVLGVLQSVGVISAPGGGGGFTGGADAWAKASAIPGWANGGAMRLGGLAGIDRNLLSLNGSPIARVSAGEVLSVSPANDTGGRLNVVVTMDRSTGALGAFVQDQAGRVVAQAAPFIARDGANQAVDAISGMNDRMLG